MNKAFVRDPEPTVDRCPRCGAAGQPVGSVVLDSYVRAEARAQLGAEASFCPTANCAVAYFDAFEREVEVGQLAQPVYPKDPDAPICGCFGFKCAEIDADLSEGVATRTRAQLERARSSSARCSQAAANGTSCVAAVQSYFMQHRGRG